MREVCHNVITEPELIPIENNYLGIRNATGDKSRPDVSGVGVWGAYEKTYLDVLITHPNCPTYADKPIESVYRMKEREKKAKYTVLYGFYRLREHHLHLSLDQLLEDGEKKLISITKELLPSLQTKGMRNILM